MVLAERSRAVRMLAEHLLSSSPAEGPRASAWSGITSYKFSSPVRWIKDPSSGISFIIVVQGSHLLQIGERTLGQDSSRGFVAGGYERVACDVLDASLQRPYLAMVWKIDPGVVRRTWRDVVRFDADRQPPAHDEPIPPSALTSSPPSRGSDWRALEVVLRADSNIASAVDRQILAPLYQQEVAYWLLNSDLGEELRTLTSTDYPNDPIADLIEHLRTHLADSWHVAQMAERAYMSTSVFSHRFRQATGRPPHQYLREMRLDHARDLIASGDLTVAQVSSQVGYRSISQFTNAFRDRFGITPGAGLVR